MATLDTKPANRGRQAGQTLIIAVIVLGVLVIIGFTFAALVGRNILEATRDRERTIASDLADAGIRFAHSQLQQSTMGADWRPSPTLPTGIDAGGFTRDPDALFLRPGSGLMLPSGTVDRGGPDGLGAFSRITFDRGRALIRVNYGPSDMQAIVGTTESLRNPGRARPYIIIESVGRPGGLLTGGRVDPSRMLNRAVQVTGFPNTTELERQLGIMRQANNLVGDTRKLMAFASVGLVNSARFITNMHKVSRPAELGFPTVSMPGEAGVGVLYDGLPVQPPTRWGGDFGGITLGTGSLWSNANLVVHGRNRFLLNADLGDMIAVAGTIEPANGNSALSVTRGYFDRAVQAWRYDWQGSADTRTNPILLAGSALDSNSPAFSTLGGVVRDGGATTDADGFMRSIAYKEPPRIDLDRYRTLTQGSGVIANNVNTGRFGFGRGVYVDSAERGNLASEDERALAGAVRSLPNDWLNPNRPGSVGWQGPFYVPVASFLRLLPDGFEIVRDSRSRRPFWRNPITGTGLNSSRIRYRVRNIGGQTFILNSMLSPALVNRPGTALSDSDFRNDPHALEFNGVIFFEGDVRVRGIIPTDQQLTVVANGTIYLDGSITKGVVNENGATLTRPSRSTIMVMAKDYVTVNTTQFFAPAPGESPAPKQTEAMPDVPSPLELAFDSTPNLTLAAQFLLDPENLGNPASARPLALDYRAFGTGTPLAPSLLLTSSADNNGPAFVALDVAPQTFADPGGGWFQSFLFPRQIDFGGAGAITFNAASNFAWPPGNIPVYGLGDPNLNAYPRFETIAFPLLDGAGFGSRRINTSGATGTFSLGVQDETLFRLRLTSAGPGVAKNFLLARAAVVPHDIRIEAAMFAEQGSFFVIPGPWFNTNPSDTHSVFESDVAAVGLEAAQRRRFESFGNSPAVPFFGEPLAVRVSILGAISENMPAPMSMQSEWLKKWGWLPRRIGGTGLMLPRSSCRPGST